MTTTTRPAEMLTCAYVGAVLRAGDDGSMKVVASDESIDRFGDEINVNGWQLANFRRNPVLLWAHDNLRPPVGRVNALTVEGKQLIADIKFDLDDPFARDLHRKYQNGFLRAFSVGFRPIEFKPMDSGGIKFIKQELLELSAVPVPAHPQALKKSLYQMQSLNPGGNVMDRKRAMADLLTVINRRTGSSPRRGDARQALANMSDIFNRRNAVDASNHSGFRDSPRVQILGSEPSAFTHFCPIDNRQVRPSRGSNGVHRCTSCNQEWRSTLDGVIPVAPAAAPVAREINVPLCSPGSLPNN